MTPIDARGLPGVKTNLVANTIAVGVIFKVKNSVAAIVLGQVRNEVFVRRVLDRLFDFNFRIVLTELENDVLVLFLELQVLEDIDAFIVDCNTGRLRL